MSDVIGTERLELRTMTPDFLRASRRGQRSAAEALLGLTIPSAWFAATDLAARRLAEFEAGTTREEWLPRAIQFRGGRDMVGYIGFHTPPGAGYLQDICPLGVEFGYTVFPAWRRRRIAWEACRGLMHWAHDYHGVRTFVVSVSPTNQASLGLVAKLGFRRIGAHLDEVDGPEDIFSLVLPPAGD